MIEIFVSREDYEKICRLDEFDVERGILQTSGAEYIRVVVKKEDYREKWVMVISPEWLKWSDPTGWEREG